MEINLIEDLAKFSGIPESKLNNLVEKSSLDIAQSVEEYLTSDEECCNINIGIGNLIVNKDEEELMFKFIPSKGLESFVTDIINDKKSPLIKELELSITKRMLKLYKELF